MAGHAQLKFVMMECSKTQIRLTGLIFMPLNLAILISLFCENDTRTPGVFKVFLYHAGFGENKSNWIVA